MKNKINISLIIPTYNDEKTIVKQVFTCENIIKKYSINYEIIIADDNSIDNTSHLLISNFLKNKNYNLVFNKKNIGITKNVYQLYYLAKYEYIIFYSADGDWNPFDLKKLIEKQQSTKADIVIGKRQKKHGYTLYRNFISTMHRLLPILFFGIDTYDPGGIKLIRRNIIPKKLISKSQFFEAEIIIRARKNGYKTVFCFVTYSKIVSGSGYGGAFISAFESFLDLLRLRIYYFNHHFL
jgi:glycosyltransferase involved in cell wall biosynthesis